MGGQMSADEKLALRRDLKALQGTNVNEFFEHLPRDMLFVFRSTNLTRSLNKELGGNSRDMKLDLLLWRRPPSMSRNDGKRAPNHDLR
ncbi:hypothetical protein DYB26_011105 [Aphanomyces astaci]|uniref:Uncharacterized protein n=1 Tax=Aphanomyces astaci TaxID=112090 RepID=A0A3R7F1Y6_APHAT|nr:hypothetical protein DYB26_011105 [Aphanomyces astaci]